MPVPDDVIGEMKRYLAKRGSTGPGSPGEGMAYVLGKASDSFERMRGRSSRDVLLDANAGIAATTLYDQIKQFFIDCSTRVKAIGDEKGAARLAKASTHWLRHTHASHAIAGGMPIEVAQQNLGHASLATTTVYVRTEEKRRMRAVSRFWEARAGR